MIVGDGFFDGGNSSIPVLLRPVPEPSSLALLAVGGLALGGAAMRGRRPKQAR
jgi:hypothetical protein